MRYIFTLFILGADVLSDDNLDALFEAGCDDATFGSRDGAQYGEFGREATSFSVALSSAIHDMTTALPGLEIVRVEPDDLVGGLADGRLQLDAKDDHCGECREVGVLGRDRDSVA